MSYFSSNSNSIPISGRSQPNGDDDNTLPQFNGDTLPQVEIMGPSPPTLFFNQFTQAINYEVCLISGNANKSLANEIAQILGVQLTPAEVKRFADGEVFVQINDNVRGKDVFVIQPTCPPVNDHLMELLLILDSLKRASPKRITAVIPYYGYARQDRKAAPRVPITARLCADLIASAGAQRLLCFELHVGQIQGFFDCPVDHMYAGIVFKEYLQSCPRLTEGDEGLCIVSPDTGGTERARKVAQMLDASLAIIDKRRPAPNVAEVLNVIGDVHNKKCIIFDDIVDTAGTLCKAAAALKERGATCVMACIVHPVLSGPAIERIQASCLDELVVTNSIPLSEEKTIPQITVLSVAKIFAETIRRIHREQSVSTLFH